MLAIIQARSSSKRFKNKIIFPIYGTPLIGHVVKKLKKSNKIKKIIIATSTHKSDDKLINYLKENKIEYYRGKLKNVADRFLKLAIKKRAKHFLRINGDSPLIDYRIVNKAINIFEKNKEKYHIITNVFPRSFPKGQSVEIVKTTILKKNINKFNNFEKEHLTQFFYNNSQNFKIRNFTFKKITKIIKFSIDTRNDLNKILKKFSKNKFENFYLKNR